MIANINPSFCRREKPTFQRRDGVKQTAIWAKCSQQWIKLYNIFTPTACHNGLLYSVSAAEYQILQPQLKYLTTRLWWLLSHARPNVLSLFDQKTLQINNGAMSAANLCFCAHTFHSTRVSSFPKCLKHSLLTTLYLEDLAMSDLESFFRVSKWGSKPNVQISNQESVSSLLVTEKNKLKKTWP